MKKVKVAVTSNQPMILGALIGWPGMVLPADWLSPHGVFWASPGRKTTMADQLDWPFSTENLPDLGVNLANNHGIDNVTLNDIDGGYLFI